jgi:predicted HTH domain antitoxin
MTGTISLEIPREIPHITRLTLAELRMELAVHLFEQGKLSFGKAREMAGLNVWDFQSLLGVREIPIHYDLAEYEEDVKILKELGRL